MAIYRLEVRIIGRSKGASAAGASAYRTGSVIHAAAYRSCGKLYDQAKGTTYDYSRKRDIAWSDILAPDGAPDWATDRQQLWNRVEQTERRKDSQLAREVLLTLPRELSPEQQRELVCRYVRAHFVERGMVADIGIHNPSASDGREQPHAHVLLTMRPLRADGSGFEGKTAGGRAREWNALFFHEGDKGVTARALGKGGLLLEWRRAWETDCNQALADAGSSERIDHRSLKDQRAEALTQAQAAREAGDAQEERRHARRAASLDRLPEPKLGVAAFLKRSKGELRDRFREWLRVKERNLVTQHLAALSFGGLRATALRTARIIEHTAHRLGLTPRPEPDPLHEREGDFGYER